MTDPGRLAVQETDFAAPRLGPFLYDFMTDFLTQKGGVQETLEDRTFKPGPGRAFGCGGYVKCLSGGP